MMIFSDKIISLRKKCGWSQEELAEKINVSRQAVSKWEAAQTTPDLDKILTLSVLFGVTTDYLLKDEIEEEELAESDSETSVKKLSLSKAGEFLEWRKHASVRIAIATMLCIISVIPLLILAAASESYGISGELAAGLGILFLFLFVAVAVSVFIYTGLKNDPYEFIDKEPFDLEYGVSGMVKERKKAYRDKYVRNNVIATCIEVLSPLPLLCGAFTQNEFLCVVLLTVTMLIAGIGVMLYIITGVRWASMQKILGEGEFSEKEKKKSRMSETVGTVYWLIAVTVYFGWSFLTNDWHISWIIWPIAGILFGGVMSVCNLLSDRDRK